ncbi:hypothetical protein PtA15_7A786 [Puccinia triticina]|uniref:Uncharacterized protein n=1 Tax=Puccinia triticina TaxID=208348 RepID=A0ABY7CWF3_9BASI|nr:uncharacterized protein PtA15_7A786 [Puccinia triticina]WAQ87057.1 hypothetical protein PtA15_7A786 [Puccinia triticina]WAR56914.1 hypothetical protein PtB15_7B767 [Puccinia triticina]
MLSPAATNVTTPGNTNQRDIASLPGAPACSRRTRDQLPPTDTPTPGIPPDDSAHPSTPHDAQR